MDQSPAHAFAASAAQHHLQRVMAPLPAMPVPERSSSPFQHAAMGHPQSHNHGLSSLGPRVTGHPASGTPGDTLAGTTCETELTIAPLDIEKKSSSGGLGDGLKSADLPAAELLLENPSMMAKLMGSFGSLSGVVLLPNMSSTGELGFLLPMSAAPSAAAAAVAAAADHNATVLQPNLAAVKAKVNAVANTASPLSPNAVSSSTTVRPTTPGSAAAAAAAFAASFNWQEVTQQAAAGNPTAASILAGQQSLAAGDFSALLASRNVSLTGEFLNAFRISRDDVRISRESWSGDMESQLPGSRPGSNPGAAAAAVGVAGSSAQALDLDHVAAHLQQYIPPGFTGDMNVNILVNHVSNNVINDGNSPTVAGITPAQITPQQFAQYQQQQLMLQQQQQQYLMQQQQQQYLMYQQHQYMLQQQQQQYMMQHGSPNMHGPPAAAAAAAGSPRKHMEASKQKPNNKMPAGWVNVPQQGFVRCASPTLDGPVYSNPAAAAVAAVAAAPAGPQGFYSITPNMAQAAATMNEMASTAEGGYTPMPFGAFGGQVTAAGAGIGAGAGATSLQYQTQQQQQQQQQQQSGSPQGGLRRRAAAARSRQYLQQYAEEASAGGSSSHTSGSRTTARGSGRTAAAAAAGSSGKTGSGKTGSGSKRSKKAINSASDDDHSYRVDGEDSDSDASVVHARKRRPTSHASSAANLAAAAAGGAGSGEARIVAGHVNKGGAVGHSSTSTHKGVTRHRWTGKWEAHLWDAHAPRKNCSGGGRTRGKQVYLGGYVTEEEAARAYDKAALAYWGETAKTNYDIDDYADELEVLFSTPKDEIVQALRRGSTGFARGESQFRGVTRHHQAGKWEARVGRINGQKYMYLGTFDTEEKAARAYDLAVLEHRGDKAITNFPASDYAQMLLTPTAAAAAVEAAAAAQQEDGMESTAEEQDDDADEEEQQ